MLQNKYQKLRRKVIGIPTERYNITDGTEIFTHFLFVFVDCFSVEKSVASAKNASARTRTFAGVESQKTERNRPGRQRNSEKTIEIGRHWADKKSAEPYRPRVVQKTMRNGT